jgi:pyruvate-formate lyase-activating enzyme
MDAAKHEKETGVSNELILENLGRIAIRSKHNVRLRVIVRVPLISGYNDSEENIRATAEFMNKINLEEVNILPFHRLGASKYERLGVAYKYKGVDPPTSDSLKEFQGIFGSYGINAYIGRATPF